MGRNISIAISVQDKFTTKITTMREVTKNFNADLGNLSSMLGTLSKTEINVKVSTKKASEDLRKLETRFKEVGESSVGIAAGINQINFENARKSLGLFRNDIHDTEKDAKNLDETTGKIGKAGVSDTEGTSKTGVSSTRNGGKADLLSNLAEAGIAKFSEDIALIADATLGSALGPDASNTIQHTASGAVSGAAMGSMIGGLPGVAIGAIAGGLIGLFGGKSENFKKEDEIFKSSVREQYEDVKQNEADTLTRGIAVAGSRDQERLDLRRTSDHLKTAEAAQNTESYQELMSRLEETQSSIDAAMGEGYIRERKKGIKEQIKYFEGESGKKLKDANRMVGEHKASLENEREEAMRNATDAMLNSDEYKKAAAEGNGAEMGKLLAVAQANGENEYKAGEGYQMQLATDLELIKKLREEQSLKDEYWNTGQVLQEEFEKGRKSAIYKKLAGLLIPNSFPEEDTPITGSPIAGATREDMLNILFAGDKQAYGLSYVPYNNFPALLHEGERVLTASEARALKGSNSSNISITGNSFIIREEADIGKIARELARNMARASALAI
ncbi:hypothetical protein HMPREF0322_04211 [Desulfitobacterium hafniense DP7]|uniref:Uncharacterized protein n=2 Tax=Desulfitobacterium hafniense TaxID=49338 RepID=G9XTA5_DESHA|nr:bacteriocin class II family protein [Desulfitobacterium hafniense]EHL05071.1 hypothetical protein HMPREF0322_04211 [Desulfitobacterium hafniense DP7]